MHTGTNISRVNNISTIYCIMRQNISMMFEKYIYIFKIVLLVQWWSYVNQKSVKFQYWSRVQET